MLEAFRYRRVTAAIAERLDGWTEATAVGLAAEGAASPRAVFVGCDALAALVRQQKTAGLVVLAAVPPAAATGDAYRAQPVDVVVAWGPLEDVAVAELAAPLTPGGRLLWFATIAPERAAGRALCGQLTEIEQRQVGRYLLTVGQKCPL